MAKVSTAQPPEATSRGSDRLNPTVARGIAFVAPLVLVVPMVIATGRMRSPTPSETAVSSASSAPSDMGIEKQAAHAYGELPLSFIPNAGQAAPQIRYAARGAGFGVSFTPGEALLSFIKGERGLTLALRFVDSSSAAALTARHQLPGTVNYLIGDPADWRTGLPTYQEVVYGDLWPGVDAVFRGEKGKLKYEFQLAPGARVSDIRLGYRGAERLSLGRGGDLFIQTTLGTLRDARPVSYQLIGGRRVPVETHYAIAQNGTHGFALGSGYDPRRPLVIDPALVYSTFLGGENEDEGIDIAVDQAGHAHITGLTNSPDNFPTTPGAFDISYNGFDDAFVTKLSPDGSALVYSTFLGGFGDDVGSGIRVDGAGHAYVTGLTHSPDFPTTPGAFDPTGDPVGEVFLTKFSPDGSALVYSTFLGGTGYDEGRGLQVDHVGQAYITGWTDSRDFPTTPGAFDTTFNGILDAFVTKVSPDGSALVYSTFLGGEFNDTGNDVAVDPLGHAYATGIAYSADFPTTPGAFDTSFNGIGDAFVTKVSPDGSALVYSTFLGGEMTDEGSDIAVERAGEASLTGATESPDFPASPGAFDTSFNGGLNDAFVTRLAADGSALVYSTFLGGTSRDEGHGIQADPAGHAYITGLTFSLDFPTTPGAFDITHNGGDDAIVTKLSSNGSALLYSTFLGGEISDAGRGIAIVIGVHLPIHAYITGETGSQDFPTTPGAFDITHNGSNDAFVSKLEIRNRTTR